MLFLQAHRDLWGFLFGSPTYPWHLKQKKTQLKHMIHFPTNQDRNLYGNKMVYSTEVNSQLSFISTIELSLYKFVMFLIISPDS